jgi:DNA polymerase
VVCLGDHASQALLGRTEGIAELRGRRFEVQGLAVFPTFHPSALLRNPALKKDVWEDMKLVLKELKGAGA